MLYLAAVDLFRHLLPQHSAQRARHPGEEVRPIQARIMRAGGVAEPTDVILETTSGAFLEDVMSQYREFEQEGLKAEGSGPDLISVKRAAGRSKTGSIVSITTCVDGRSTDFIKQGKPIGSGVLARDDNYFARVDGLLKVVGADGKEVESC